MKSYVELAELQLEVEKRRAVSLLDVDGKEVFVGDKVTSIYNDKEVLFTVKFGKYYDEDDESWKVGFYCLCDHEDFDNDYPMDILDEFGNVWFRKVD